MMIKIARLGIALLIPLGALAQHKKPVLLPQLGKSTLQQVINALTLEEKAKLVAGTETQNGQTGKSVPYISYRTYAIPRLGIPSITIAEETSGLPTTTKSNKGTDSTCTTNFPAGMLLASSWDTALVHQVGLSMGNEARNCGVDVLLAPSMNIQRNPLDGDFIGYYSEDPLLSGCLAASLIKGVQATGVGAAVKHFAINDRRANPGMQNTYIGERALREIYLKGFEIAINQAQPRALLPSHIGLNGYYTPENYDLLTTILRKEWNFKGAIFTDGLGGKSAAAQINAGNDFFTPGTSQQVEAIISGVKAGVITTGQLNMNVEHVLNLIVKSPSFKHRANIATADLKTNALIARTATSESMVLLKNTDNTLPLKSGFQLALFGNPSYHIITSNSIDTRTENADSVNPRQAFINAGFNIDTTVASTYKHYVSNNKDSTAKASMSLSPAKIETDLENAIYSQAITADAAIIIIGRAITEGAEREIKNDFTLSDSEQTMIKNVSAAFHAKNKKVVVLLNVAGVIETASWRDEADAILLTSLPGTEGSNAIADVLSGKVNPSGKLPVTFPVAYPDVPSAVTFPGKLVSIDTSATHTSTTEATYSEGIYEGYRYYNTFNVKPAYEFGYGLSYTQFGYSNLKLNSTTFNGSITATVTITNTGNKPGKEVVELYVSAPALKLSKPESELKAFTKTRLLQPGQSQDCSFTLTTNDLASYVSVNASWVAEAGEYKVKLGNSSLNILQTATFILPKDVRTERVHKVLTWSVANTYKQ